jgi:hypothetical protein
MANFANSVLICHLAERHRYISERKAGAMVKQGSTANEAALSFCVSEAEI